MSLHTIHIQTMAQPSQSSVPESDAGSFPVDIHKPFTPAERIQQLGEIDNVSLFYQLEVTMHVPSAN
jgi:hypothetical protein